MTDHQADYDMLAERLTPQGIDVGVVKTALKEQADGHTYR